MKLTDKDRALLNEYRMALDKAEAEYTNRDIIHASGSVPNEDVLKKNYKKKETYEEALRNWNDFLLELEEKGYDKNHIQNLDGLNDTGDVNK